MRNILIVIIICSFATMSAYADITHYNKSFGQTDYDEMTSSRAVMNSPRYSSPIYEPFSNTLPSEETDMTSSSEGPKKVGPRKGFITPPRKGFITPDDYGQGPSPIGDALFPLLAMALVFGGITLLRRRRSNS